MHLGEYHIGICGRVSAVTKALQNEALPIPDAVSIEQRPAVADERGRLGD